MKSLCRIALVAVAVMSLARSTQAAGVTCVAGDDTLFPGVADACETLDNFYSPSNTSEEYFFNGGAVINELAFDNVVHEMMVTMSAFFVVPGNTAFLARVPDGFTPATFDTFYGDRWVYFRVEDLQPTDQTDPEQAGTDAPPQNPDDFTGNWTQTIRWFALDDTNQIFEVLHDNRPLGATPGNGFQDVITVPNSFDPDGDPDSCPPSECSSDLLLFLSHDPAIGGSADDFSDTLVTVSHVPEPATMMLVLTGLAGAGFERRRRKNATK